MSRLGYILFVASFRVQVATELYHVVEENSAYDQNFAHRMESPSAFFASGMVDRMRSDRHLIDAHSVESSSHNGAQVILWKEQNHPRSFAEAQGVLSDVHNLKKEVWHNYQYIRRISFREPVRWKLPSYCSNTEQDLHANMSNTDSILCKFNTMNPFPQDVVT